MHPRVLVGLMVALVAAFICGPNTTTSYVLFGVTAGVALAVVLSEDFL